MVVNGVLLVLVFVLLLPLSHSQALAGNASPLQPRPGTSQLFQRGKKSPDEDFIFIQVRVPPTQQVFEKSEKQGLVGGLERQKLLLLL